MTNTTPWSGLDREGCGWCVPWENFSATLAPALAVKPRELEAMGRRGRDWAARDFSWEGAARLLGEFYHHLRDERAPDRHDLQ